MSRSRLNSIEIRDWPSRLVDEIRSTPWMPAIWRSILVKFLSVNGFIISNHFDRYPAFLAEVAPKLASGEIRYLEDVAEGLENAPAAFMSMLRGGNTGKQIVKLI